MATPISVSLEARVTGLLKGYREPGEPQRKQHMRYSKNPPTQPPTIKHSEKFSNECTSANGSSSAAMTEMVKRSHALVLWWRRRCRHLKLEISYFATSFHAIYRNASAIPITLVTKRVADTHCPCHSSGQGAIRCLARCHTV